MSKPSRKSRLENGGLPSREAIKLYAYELYIERGCLDGHDVEDWLRAERDLLAASDGSPSVVKAVVA